MNLKNYKNAKTIAFFYIEYHISTHFDVIIFYDISMWGE